MDNEQTEHGRKGSGTGSISFSGVDGAGKSTQIDQLLAMLAASGFSTRVLRFWDDIATLKRFREEAGHRIFRGDKGIGRPEAPIHRRDKNVRGLPMTVVRMVIYLADAVSLCSVFHRVLGSGVDFVIFDRYIYDELANLNFKSRLLRSYVRLIMRLVPRPELSFILDADPEAARARKPEYPLPFIRVNRQAYLDLARIVGGLTVIPPSGIEAACREVRKHVAGIIAVDAAFRMKHQGSHPDPDAECRDAALSGVFPKG